MATTSHAPEPDGSHTTHTMGKIIRCPECGKVYRNLDDLEDLRDNDSICLVCNAPIEVSDWDRVLASYEDDDEDLDDVDDDDADWDDDEDEDEDDLEDDEDDLDDDLDDDDSVVDYDGDDDEVDLDDDDLD